MNLSGARTAVRSVSSARVASAVVSSRGMSEAERVVGWTAIALESG